MFILFGSPRSGTTLLAATLHQHDRIVVPDETDFIIPVAFLVDRVKDPALGRPLVKQLILAADLTRRSLGEYLDQREIDAAVDRAEYSACAIVRSVYDTLARKADVDIAGDKSPNDLLFARILMKMGFLDSGIRVIHLVRDVRDVVLSIERQDWGLQDVAGWFPRLWNTSNLYVHELMRERAETYHLLRYEDLVRQPESHVRRVTEFLGVPFEPAMLEHRARGRRYVGAKAHGNLQQPFMASRAMAWREAMSPAARARVEDAAREALQTFGYPV